MTALPLRSRPAPLPPIVRRIMHNHGLSEPSARAVASLANGEAAFHG
ncbi:hypothetical protein [Parasedimentitalea maritima]|uniref:Uncharacterized protein n=1 Tax=Parasedimentitalea maritima TaxID=2578117 RepID=A0A6A4RA61_9RHOB|nr:hypothetical protein [Zongyanglinia marina]KAE9625940.1 hypothetical protein GP644_22055 [Zongyanglinia marina]